MAGLTVETSKISGFYNTTVKKYDGLFGDQGLTEIALVPRIRLQTGDILELLEDVVMPDGNVRVHNEDYKGKAVIYMTCKVMDSRGRFVGYQVYNASMLYAMPTTSYKDSRQYSPLTKILSRDEKNALVEKVVNTNKDLIESVKEGMKFRVTRIFSEWEKGGDKDAPRRYQWGQIL